MRPPNEFWLCLHRLAQAYDAEGVSSEQRGENIVLQFNAMPPIARRQVLGELAELATALSELYPQMVIAGKHHDQSADQGPPADRQLPQGVG